MTKKLIAVICALFSPVLLAAEKTQPNLIVQITVDGLRGDLLERYKHNFGDDGFRYLMNNGTYYTNAHYQHANTETIVGHVSLATGAPPSVHGMVGNVWYDRQQQRLVYNVEDGQYPLLSNNGGVNADTEIDPTQRAAKLDGRSPSTILSTTFSDELVMSNNGQSKNYSVSIKDRGAISLSGHSGKAFWFSKTTQQFVSSQYYYDHYPQWVDRWNNNAHAEKYANTAWELSLKPEQYTLTEVPHEHKTRIADFGTHFPHHYGTSTDKYYSTLLTLSPAGDELTAEFANELLKQERLGQSSATDYLAISFASNDYVIHMFGPNSLETEDNLIRLDRTIAKLLKSIDKEVGLENTLIVLSADHGVPEASSVAHHLGHQYAHYFNTDELITDQLRQRLADTFGLDDTVIHLYSPPYVYLDHKKIKQKSLNLSLVQAVIAEEMEKISGIQYAITSSDVIGNKLPTNNRTMQLIQNNHHSERSGDIYIVFSPRTYVNDMDGLTIASTHGSPWRYDTHVPVIFSGWEIPTNKTAEAITPYDIAPTLSNLLGITHPSGSTGNVLPLK
ncbi:TPA: alkaline phosphatase family protein [Photobacterium damselae]